MNGWVVIVRRPGRDPHVWDRLYRTREAAQAACDADLERHKQDLRGPRLRPRHVAHLHHLHLPRRRPLVNTVTGWVVTATVNGCVTVHPPVHPTPDDARAHADALHAVVPGRVAVAHLKEIHWTEGTGR